MLVTMTRADLERMSVKQPENKEHTVSRIVHDFKDRIVNANAKGETSTELLLYDNRPEIESKVIEKLQEIFVDVDIDMKDVGLCKMLCFNWEISPSEKVTAQATVQAMTEADEESDIAKKIAKNIVKKITTEINEEFDKESDDGCGIRSIAPQAMCGVDGVAPTKLEDNHACSDERHRSSSEYESDMESDMESDDDPLEINLHIVVSNSRNIICGIRSEAEDNRAFSKGRLKGVLRKMEMIMVCMTILSFVMSSMCTYVVATRSN